MDEQQITEEQGHAGGNGGDDNRPQVVRAGNGGDDNRPQVVRAGNGGDDNRPQVVRAGDGGDDNRPQVVRDGNGGDESRPRLFRAGSGGDESRPRLFRAGSGGEERQEAHGHAEESVVHAGGESERTGARMVKTAADTLRSTTAARSVLSTGAQQVLTEWIGYSQQALERNSRALGKLMGCRTAKDVVDVQFNLFKANVEDWLHGTGAVFQISTEKAREAADRMREAASRSAR